MRAACRKAGGLRHLASTLRSPGNASFSAVRSLGKWPWALTARRTVELRLSIALVACIARRIGSENAKNGTTRSHAERLLLAMAGYFPPHGPASKSSSAASVASAVGARWRF